MVLKGDETTEIVGVFYKDRNSTIERQGRFLGEIVSELTKVEVPLVGIPETHN